MSRRTLRTWILLVCVVLAAAGMGTFAFGQLPVWGAGGLLHPARRRVTLPPPTRCEEAVFAGAGISLQGWRCHCTGNRRGTVVYLHGIADNRTSAIGVIDRFGARGFEVIAYDGRAHGESQGDVCTYGWFEKQDLRRVLDSVAPGPVVLVGTSLGAAIALQEAAQDPRVSAVVAAEVFSDLRTVAVERAPFFLPPGAIAKAFEIAERQGHFRIDDASPVHAAEHITAPVLLIHGEADLDTRPAHSRRVFDALRGPKRLILVPGAAHNGSLRPEVWDEIDRWLDDVLATRPGASGDRYGSTRSGTRSGTVRRCNEPGPGRQRWRVRQGSSALLRSASS